MSFYAIQKDVMVKELLFAMPECHTEFEALGANLKELLSSDVTLDQLCREFNFDTDTFIKYLRFRLDDLA